MKGYLDNMPQQQQQNYQAKGFGLQQTLNQGPVEIGQRSFKDPVFAVLYIALWITSLVLLIVRIKDYEDMTGLKLDFKSLFAFSKGYTAEQREKFMQSTFAIIGISFVLSAIFAAITPYIAGCVIYGFLLLVGLGLAALAVAGFAQEQSGLGIFVLIVLLIYCLFMYCMRSKIRKAIVILKASSRFVIEHPSSLAVSVLIGLFWIMSILIHLFGVFINILIIQRDESKDKPIITYIQYFMIYWSNFFSDLWLQLSLSFFVCSWYFSYTNGSKDDSRMKGIFCTSLWVALRKHLGSLSFASILLAILEVIKDRIDSQTKHNPLGIFIRCICRCIIEWIKQFSKIAVTMMALTGDSFCDAASDGTNIVLKNFGQYVAVQFVGDFYARLGALFLAVLSGLIAYFISKDVIATIVGVLIGWCIAKLFLDIIQVATNASLFYIVVDRQLNGSIRHGHPQYQDIQKESQDTNIQGMDNYNQLDTTRNIIQNPQQVQMYEYNITNNNIITPQQQMGFQQPQLIQNPIGFQQSMGFQQPMGPQQSMGFQNNQFMVGGNNMNVFPQRKF